MTEMPKNLDEAMAIFQANLPTIAKDEKATVKSDKGQYSYGYAGLDTVSEKVLRALGKLGVSWRTRPTVNAEGKFVLAYRLRHVGGEEEVGEWPLTGGTPQQIGSSITYARRYALMAVTGVFPSNEDDDGAAAATAAPHDDWESATPARPARAEQPPTRPTPEQNGACEEFLGRIKAAASREEIDTIGGEVRRARAAGTVTPAQYDRLGRAAGHRLGEMEVSA